MEGLKEVYCNDQVRCGFMVRSHNDDELVNVLKAHAKNVHELDPSDEEIRAKIQSTKTSESPS